MKTMFLFSVPRNTRHTGRSRWPNCYSTSSSISRWCACCWIVASNPCCSTSCQHRARWWTQPYGHGSFSECTCYRCSQPAFEYQDWSGPSRKCNKHDWILLNSYVHQNGEICRSLFGSYHWIKRGSVVPALSWPCDSMCINIVMQIFLTDFSTEQLVISPDESCAKLL